MFFTFAVYSIIFAIGSEVDSLPSSSLAPSTITSTPPTTLGASTSTESIKDNLIGKVLSSSNRQGFTVSANGLSSTGYSKPNTLTIDLRSTGHGDLDLFSRPDDSNYRSTGLRSDDISEDDGLTDGLGTTESSGPTITNFTSSMAAVYQEEPDNMFTSSPLGTLSGSHPGSMTITSSGLQSANHEICDFCIYEGEGNFTSYGYPLPYRSNLNCSYRIQKVANESPDYCELDLIFHDFDVPISSIAGVTSGPNSMLSECNEDYLLVAGRKFCGNHWRGRAEVIPFPLNQREVTFNFISNERVSGRGFWVEVRKRPGTCLQKKAMRACEERYSDSEFYITSPQFPSGYPNNAECTYHIRRSDQSVCGLEFKFLHFDLEPGEGCAYDYLSIDGQRFCGTVSPHTVKQVKFDEDQKVLVFHSDKQLPRSGFHLLVRQLRKCGPSQSLPPPPNCNICTDQKSGILVSYGYPNPYRNNLLCSYTLEKANSDMCAVEFKFDDFDLVPSNDCTEDYLSFGGSKFCGSTLYASKRILEFGSNNTVEMTFRTDGSSHARGFSASYRQLPCSSTGLPTASSSTTPARDITPLPAKDKPTTTKSIYCDRHFTDKHFLLQSYNYSANYPNNLDCTITVHRNSSKVCYIELTFLMFDVEASPQCQYDYLEINNVRLCGTLQRETTRTYIFEGVEKVIKFHSDNSSNRGGFLIRAEQLECHGDAIIRNMSDIVPTTDALLAEQPIPCDTVITDQTFEIISPLYPSPYPRSSECVYMIHKFDSRICRLEVTYYDFELQGVNSHGYCSSDYLDFNGIRMCGVVNKNSVRNYYFPESKFSIRFHADSSLSGRGFRLGVKQAECIEPASEQPSTLPSTTITTSPPPSTPLASTTQRVQTHQCDQVFTSAFAEIVSPGWPTNYPSSTRCQYTIIKRTDVGPICQLEVNVINFELDQTINCQGDYLDFEKEIICGSLPSGTVKLFPFNRPEFLIKFKSDSLDTVSSRRGFFLQIRQRECIDGFSVSPSKLPTTPSVLPEIINQQQQQTADKKRLEYCGSILRGHKFELKSPLFPAPYEAGLDCPYTVKRSHPNICFLDLFFLDFELQDDKECNYDYLSIGGKRYCGIIKPGAIQTYAFENHNEISIVFHTDRSSSGRGFYIRGSQRECDPTTTTVTTASYEKPPTTPSNRSNGSQINQILPHLQPVPSICEFCFASRDGEIKSYDHPDLYPANLDCNYRITALPGHCAVYLKFDVFDLEESRNGHCIDDYLEIEGDRYCGNQLSRAQKLLDFNGKPQEVVLRFHSNEFISGQGFRVSYAQIACNNLGVNQMPLNAPDKPIPQIIADSSPISVLDSNSKISSSSAIGVDGSSIRRVPCDLVVFDARFEISTPGYPYIYPNNADCLFSIRRANYNICKLRLEFVDFDVASSLNCESDHLDIEGERICGIISNNTIREFDFHNYKIALRFRSGDYSSRRGFFIRGQQIECYDHNKSPPYPSNSADFPSYSSYENRNSFMSSSAPLPQSGSSGSYPPSPSHQARQTSQVTPLSGTINVSDNRETNSSSQPPINQQNIQEEIDSQQTPVQQFNSFGSPSSCDKTITEGFFELQSINYPSRYLAGSKCSIIIKKANPSVCHLDLMFIHFDVGSGSCTNDYLSIDGERLCGSISGGTVKTFNFDLPEKFIFFRGDFGQGVGFNIRARQVECGPTTQTSQLLNRSPVSLKSPSSRSNEIRNPFVSSFSSSSPSSPLSSASSSSSFDHFSSNLPYCDQIFSTDSFTLTSPNHPNNYPNNLYCQYTIRRPSSSVCAIDITFNNFDLEESSGCTNDYLEIDKSRICGLLPPNHKRRYNYFDGQDLEKTLILRTDSHISKSGFSLKINQVTGCSPTDSHHHHTNRQPSKSQCNECMKDLVGQITSDHYPNNYGNNADCNYRIASAGPQYCKVTVYIRDLDIEESEACDKDYLYVDGQRFCNTNYKPKPMTIYFPEYGPREITFSFHSDSKGTGRGFFLDYMQQSCSTASPSLSPSTMSKSPFYPSNHVAKAVIEEIVETKVAVLDHRPNTQPNYPSVSAKDSIYVGDSSSLSSAPSSSSVSKANLPSSLKKSS
uniref:CUB domain-containing protein n=1 Tax=Tetranychus urticae TaxID=32264 RepID=T1KQ91_TETUR